MEITSNDCTVTFDGRNGLLRMLAYELIYYKKILEFNHSSSTFLHTKIVPTGNQWCSAVNGYGGCIGYDASTHVPSFKIFPNNYFSGVNDFGAVGKIKYSIDINSNTLDVYLSGAGFRHSGILFFSYVCPKGFYLKISDRSCLKCPSNCLVCDESQCF
jgi:hypothetical protein